LLKGHLGEITNLYVMKKISTLVSISVDGSVNFWGYGRILPAYFRNKCYLKLLVTEL
jgi:hypothetical protein